MMNQFSLTQKIILAATQDLAALLEAAIDQACNIGGREPFYYIEVEENHERLALELRNTLKQEGLEFNLRRHENGYLFSIFGDLRALICRLHDQNSPLFAAMEFA